MGCVQWVDAVGKKRVAGKLHIQCNLSDSFCGIGLYIGSHWQFVKFESKDGEARTNGLQISV